MLKHLSAIYEDKQILIDEPMKNHTTFKVYQESQSNRVNRIEIKQSNIFQ